MPQPKGMTVLGLWSLSSSQERQEEAQQGYDVSRLSVEIILPPS